MGETNTSRSRKFTITLLVRSFDSLCARHLMRAGNLRTCSYDDQNADRPFWSEVSPRPRTDRVCCEAPTGKPHYSA